MSHNEPTIASILRALATQYDGPIAERLVLEKVLEQRPSNAKNPFATIRERLRWDGLALGWLRLDRGELVPLRVVLKGLRFRYIPRPGELDGGVLPLVRLQPFVGLRNAAPLLRDSDQHALPAARTLHAVQRWCPDLDGGAPGFDLTDWYRRTGFVAGDSIVATITAVEPLTLQIEREPAASFRRADVADQDQELLAAIVERVYRSQAPLLPCDELILPIYARALWRTGYPGHPWQQLVARERRLHLIDHIFVTSYQYGSRLVSSGDLQAERDWQADDAVLHASIRALQDEIGRSREHDAAHGLWDGRFQRASARSTPSDSQPPWDDDRATGRASAWPDDDSGYPEPWDADPLDDDLFSRPAEFEAGESDLPLDMHEATRRLMAALPPDAVQRLQNARPEEAEVIIATYLNDLLVREPSLFVTIDLSQAPDQSPDSQRSDSLDFMFDSLWDDDDDDWGDEWDDLEEQDAVIGQVYMRSSELMSQFYDHLVGAGRSHTTARHRTRLLWVYAEFLAHYYRRALDAGDYATLDECLFYFYPRKIARGSPRQVRELCTSLKQFYAFLKERGDVASDDFALALWRRRDQAARVVELYDALSSDSPSFERFSALLFAPYAQPE